MHQSVMDWVGAKVEELGLADASPVLEVGSRNVNGSVREFFRGLYLGVDLRDGPGVDFVWDIERGPTWVATYPVVVCTEMLEHTPHPHRAVQVMADSLRPGGSLLLTTRGIHFDHHDPPDYWRFTVECLDMLCAEAGLTVRQIQGDPQASGLFVHAVK